MTVSVVIPACNEERTVASVVRAALAARGVLEVLVVDDGSRDRTAEQAAAAGARVIRLRERNGKGGAMAAGAAAYRGDVVCSWMLTCWACGQSTWKPSPLPYWRAPPTWWWASSGADACAPTWPNDWPRG